MLREVTSSIQQVYKERATSPLLGAYVVAWSLFNYRFIMVLFSDMDIMEKFVWVDSSYDYWEFGFRIVVGPVVSILLWLYLYPRLAIPYYSRWLTNQRELYRLRLQADAEKPISNEEASELRAKIIQLEQAKAAPMSASGSSTLSTTKANLESNIQLWDEDFSTFAKSADDKMAFQNQLDILFQGSTSNSSIERYGSLSAWGLLEGDGWSTSLTEKGKYFARRLKMVEVEKDKIAIEGSFADKQVNVLCKMTLECISKIDQKRSLKVEYDLVAEFLNKYEKEIAQHASNNSITIFQSIKKNWSYLREPIHKGEAGTISAFFNSLEKEVQNYLILTQVN